MPSALQLAALQAGSPIAPPTEPNSKEKRRALRAAGRRDREANPEQYIRKRTKDRQAKPGGRRH